jgi:L-asparaginase
VKITIITTGGTIDKVYFDDKSEYQVGDPQVVEVLKTANVSIETNVIPLFRKDSLHLTDNDRRRIRKAVEDADSKRVLITHGTDTMIDTAKALLEIPEKTIVLTGSMQPARFRLTDAVFNVACALTASQLLPAGVYIAMNGRIFDPRHTRKNPKLNRFESLPVKA